MKAMTVLLISLITFTTFASTYTCQDYTDNLYPYKNILIETKDLEVIVTFPDAPVSQKKLIYDLVVENEVKITAMREELILPIGKKGLVYFNVYKNPIKLQKLGTVGPGVFYPLGNAEECNIVE